MPEGEQIAGIRAGALWPYLQELNLYRCPSGYPGERLNYSVVDGMTASFADGHAEYWQWKGVDTIEWGRFSEQRHVSNNRLPETAEGFEDLHRLQRAVWGRLGYEPTQ